VFCKDETVELSVLGIFSSCKWSDGTTDIKRSINRMNKRDIEYLEVCDNKGCSKRLYLPSIKWSNPDAPTIEVLGKSVLCNSDSTILMAQSGYRSYVWNNGQKGRIISITKPGDYIVTVIDSLGCESVSLPMSISGIDLDNFLSSSFSGKRELEFDSTVLGSKTCIQLSFTNRNTQLDYQLELPYILRNIEFSMPMGQFPIRIKPGDSLTLSICFSPDSIGIWRDTIVFRDTCSSLIFPLKGTGIPFVINEKSDCDISVTSTIITTGHKQLFTIMPNPVRDQLTIQSNVKDIIVQTVAVLDIYGNIHQVQSSTQLNKSHCIIPDHISSGMYIPLLQTVQGIIQLQPILIIK